MIHLGDNHSTIGRGILPLRKSTETTNTLKAWNREKNSQRFQKKRKNVISVIICSPVTMMYYMGILVFVAL